jgi:molecular chaperone HtpG
MKKSLGDKVKDVRFSDRLVSSPCCLLADKFAPSRQMERIMKAMSMDTPDSKRTLELNPSHPIVRKLCTKSSEGKDEATLANFAELLYGLALVADGEHPPDGAAFVENISALLS